MNKENCALKLVDAIILYYDARSKKHQRIYLSIVIQPVAMNKTLKLKHKPTDESEP